MSDKKMESYILNQEILIQDHLIKYLENGLIRVKRYIDEKRTLQEFYDDTKVIYWTVKENQMKETSKELCIEEH